MLEVVFARAGDYEIGLRARLGNCSSELYKTVSIVSGSEDTQGTADKEEERTQDGLQLTVYPNPAGEDLFVQVTAPERETVTVSLVSALTGEEIIKERHTGQLDYLLRWNIDKVRPGTYYLITQLHKKITSKKIVVVR